MERKYIYKLPMAFSSQPETWQLSCSEVYPTMPLISTAVGSPPSLRASRYVSKLLANIETSSLREKL